MRTDREGVKIFADGVLYAVQLHDRAATPAPWLALGAAVWLGCRPPRRVALLGYGGGTLARLLRGADPRLLIQGVEPDPDMRRLSCRHLAARVPRVHLFATDAVRFLADSARSRFDAILDDVYAPIGGRLSRPADVEPLPRLARRRLAAGGVYAVSLASPGGGAERRTAAALQRAFRHVLEVYPGEYAHKVLIGTNHPVPRGGLTLALRRLLDPGLRNPAEVGLDRVRRLGGRTG